MLSQMPARCDGTGIWQWRAETGNVTFGATPISCALQFDSDATHRKPMEEAFDTVRVRDNPVQIV